MGKFHKNPLNILAVILVVLGLFLIIYFTIDYIKFENFKETAVETVGVITDIEVKTKIKDGKQEKSYTIFYEYIVDGETYEKKSGIYDKSMKINSPITIYYDINNPSSAMQDRDGANWLFIGLGSVFGLIGLYLLFIDIRKRFKCHRLQKIGYIAYAKVISFTTDNSTTIGNKHPIYLECMYEDSMGKEYKFKSTAILDDIDESVLGKTIPVYVNPTNSEDYFVNDAWFN